MKEYKIDTKEQEYLIKNLQNREDEDAVRIKRYLNMPDLSRTSGSPLKEIVDRVSEIPFISNFSSITIPEIVPSSVCFDLFDFAPNHPARSKSDTYYVDDKNILRTHDTVMWFYYLNLPEIKEKIKNKEDLGVICYGKVYRKDEIDRRHMNVFHQLGGLYLVSDNKKTLNLDDLKNILSEIVISVFGKDVKYRFNVDTFPYTDPSLEVEVFINDNWVEILGGGMPKPSVLKNFGLEGYNGWAFGFGLERLAIIGMELPDIRLLWSQDERVKKQLHLGNKFKEVSKYPPIVRDISFIVSKEFIPNNYFDLIRETVGEDLIEEVKFLDKYEDESKFGKDKISYAFRIVYRSIERTLTNEEVDSFHKKLEEITKSTLKAIIR